MRRTHFDTMEENSSEAKQQCAMTHWVVVVHGSNPCGCYTQQLLHFVNLGNLRLSRTYFHPDGLHHTTGLCGLSKSVMWVKQLCTDMEQLTNYGRTCYRPSRIM